jgi:hypothetical protein
MRHGIYIPGMYELWQAISGSLSAGSGLASLRPSVSSDMMAAVDEDSFWRLIEHCTPDGPDPGARGLAASLAKTLSSGPVYRVVGFAEQLSWALYRLDRREDNALLELA